MTNTRTPVEVFLLIGQSNMAGRGPLDAVPPILDPNIHMFRDGQWLDAREPLHTDKPEIAGVGLGMSFAQAIRRQEPGPAVGLIPCAVGGTALARWMPGADLYAAARSVTRQALSAGKLKGILWHQGENDSQRIEDAQSYGTRLCELIGALRADLNASAVPFIVGELGAFLAEREGCAGGYQIVNQQLRDLRRKVPRYGCVCASGLKDQGDHLHFDSPSLREFGFRYAREYQQTR